jgi:hypothetical protein
MSLIFGVSNCGLKENVNITKHDSHLGILAFRHFGILAFWGSEMNGKCLKMTDKKQDITFKFSH